MKTAEIAFVSKEVREAIQAEARKELEQERDTLKRSNAELEKNNEELVGANDVLGRKLMQTAAQVERLKAAMKFCQEHAVFPIGMVEDNPTPWDYVEHTLSITPSDALKEYMKPWVEFVEWEAQKRESAGENADEARQLLASIGEVNRDEAAAPPQPPRPS